MKKIAVISIAALMLVLQIRSERHDITLSGTSKIITVNANEGDSVQLIGSRINPHELDKNNNVYAWEKCYTTPDRIENKYEVINNNGDGFLIATFKATADVNKPKPEVVLIQCQAVVTYQIGTFMEGLSQIIRVIIN